MNTDGTLHGPIDPIGAGSQWGVWTDEETRTSAVGFAMVGSRYYDAAAGKYQTLTDRFGPTSDGNEDDGRETVLTFQLVGAVPILGAPFSLAMGVSDFRDGDYLGGTLNTLGAAAGAVEAASAANALRGSSAFAKTGMAVEEGAQAGRTEISVSDAIAEASGAKSNCLPGGPECFIAGTPVQTEQGSKPVEQVKPVRWCGHATRTPAKQNSSPWCEPSQR